MNICEITEKNIGDAIELINETVKSYRDSLDNEIYSDEGIARSFEQYRNNDDISFIFMERGIPTGMFTACKPSAEILNLHIRHDKISEQFREKFFEFAVKQFSAITRVMVWVCSLDFDTIDMIENYGFEYTGEQEYVNKEKTVLRYKYMYRRKK